MSARVLVTDDDAAIRTVVREALRRGGFVVETAATLAEQARAIARARPDLLVTDVVLPDGDGLIAAAALRARHPTLPIIVLSAQNTFMTAMRAAEGGAFDYLPKPFDLDHLLKAVRQALVREGGEPGGADSDGIPLIGRSPAMQEVYRTITRVMGNDLPVLIGGEAGTGKRLVARTIHEFGARRTGALVHADLTAMPPELIERELFGEAGGIPGRICEASGGTLLLGGIEEAPTAVQNRLLRLLGTADLIPLGGSDPVAADVRIIATTRADLPALLAAGRFREDLYYRLNVLPIILPPLRDRIDDVSELARHFLDAAAAEGLPRKRLDANATACLAGYPWPGNVRELANMMRRLATLARDTVIDGALIWQQLAPVAPVAGAPADDVNHLATALDEHVSRHFARYGTSLPPDGLYHRMLVELERPLLRHALTVVRGNQLRAARLLGLNRNTLRKKLTELGVDPRTRGSD